LIPSHEAEELIGFKSEEVLEDDTSVTSLGGSSREHAQGKHKHNVISFNFLVSINFHIASIALKVI
tara:strand:+ start:90 stop:287 length:198 start_codon:yes stop_codon:yes gene_type:complete